MDTSSQSVNAVENAYRLLLELQEHGGLTLTEITREVDLSKSAVHKQLATLESIGFVTKDRNEYDIGLQLLTLGGLARDRSRLFQVGRRTVDDLSQQTEELGVLSIEDRGDSMTLYQVRRERAVATGTYLGMRQPMNCTATGKSMLAFLPVALHG